MRNIFTGNFIKALVIDELLIVAALGIWGLIGAIIPVAITYGALHSILEYFGIG